MVTNALSPMRIVESFQDLVRPTGTIGIMSSGQGSIANNENGHYEIYRASKAALNMLMRSFGARYAGPGRPRGAVEYRRQHTNPCEYHGCAGRNSRSSVSGLPRSEGSVVSANRRIVAVEQAVPASGSSAPVRFADLSAGDRFGSQVAVKHSLREIGIWAVEAAVSCS